jgi:hypothetical protein
MPVDQIEEALSQLDIGERALLDLSVHRGFDDDRIAKLLGIDVSEVGTLRRAALEKLFRIRAANGDGARDAVRAELRSVSDAGWIDPATETQETRERERRIRPAMLAGAAVLIAIVAVVIVLIASGGDSDTSAKPAAAPSQPSSAPSQPAPAPARSAPVALAPVSSAASGSVTATVSGSGSAQRLTLQLRGLPSPHGGAYELWLYDSLIHSHPLGSTGSGSGTISARLPANASNYSWLDLSLQPGADRVHHSGESVFRAPLSKVLR